MRLITKLKWWITVKTQFYLEFEWRSKYYKLITLLGLSALGSYAITLTWQESIFNAVIYDYVELYWDAKRPKSSQLSFTS